MRSVFRSLQQSALAALQKRETPDPLAAEEARAAERARIAQTLAQVADIAYVEPTARTIELVGVPAAAPVAPETASADAVPSDEPQNDAEMYAALRRLLAHFAELAQARETPLEFSAPAAVPEEWVNTPLAPWLEARGERAYRRPGKRGILYRYFQTWEDGAHQQMWSVYVSSPEKPDARCISLPLALRMVERFQGPEFMPKSQLIAWRT